MLETKIVYICGRGAGMIFRNSSGFGVKYIYCTRERIMRRGKEQLQAAIVRILGRTMTVERRHNILHVI